MYVRLLCLLITCIYQLSCFKIIRGRNLILFLKYQIVSNINVNSKLFKSCMYSIQKNVILYVFFEILIYLNLVMLIKTILTRMGRKLTTVWTKISKYLLWARPIHVHDCTILKCALAKKTFTNCDQISHFVLNLGCSV